MENTSSDSGRVVGNVGMLDLRNATIDTLSSITRIENVGAVLYSSETAGLLARLKVGNVGSLVEVPADAKAVTGQITFNQEFFRGQSAPLSLVVLGQVLISADLREEELAAGLDRLFVVGQVICPDHLAGTLQSKLRQITGEVAVYPAQARLITGKFVLDQLRLNALEDGANLFVAGALDLPEVLDNTLLAQKIGTLGVRGNIRCHAENAPALMARLQTGGTAKPAKVSVVPAGFALVERPLVLDDIMLAALPGRKLYCTGRVQIAPQVTPAVLEERLEALISEGRVFCPAALRDIIAARCNPLENKLLIYEGDLWLIENESRLAPGRLEYAPRPLTLVVFGELTIDPAVDPAAFAGSVAAVHNFGEIHCSSAQMGAVQARLVTDEGSLSDSDAAPNEGPSIGNVGHLAL